MFRGESEQGQQWRQRVEMKPVWVGGMQLSEMAVPFPYPGETWRDINSGALTLTNGRSKGLNVIFITFW